MNRPARQIIALILLGCAAMAAVELGLEPPYAVKSALKALFFLALPLLTLGRGGGEGLLAPFRLERGGLLPALGLGVSVYGLILGAFWLTRGVFDYPAIVSALAADQGVTRQSLPAVAAYIALGNSLLEEFFFRALAFLTLSRHIGARGAWLFSAAAFALYHGAMLWAAFPLPLLLLCLLGLGLGGALFNALDRPKGNIYNGWMVHLFADLALMRIAFLLL